MLVLNPVAPYVGAWIETSVGTGIIGAITGSHPTWVRGLKPEYDALGFEATRRTLRGGVD